MPAPRSARAPGQAPLWTIGFSGALRLIAMWAVLSVTWWPRRFPPLGRVRSARRGLRRTIRARFAGDYRAPTSRNLSGNAAFLSRSVMGFSIHR
jgi:hypothetical protein